MDKTDKLIWVSKKFVEYFHSLLENKNLTEKYRKEITEIIEEIVEVYQKDNGTTPFYTPAMVKEVLGGETIKSIIARLEDNYDQLSGIRKRTFSSPHELNTLGKSLISASIITDNISKQLAFLEEIVDALVINETETETLVNFSIHVNNLRISTAVLNSFLSNKIISQ